MSRYDHEMIIDIVALDTHTSHLQRDEPPPKISKLAIAAETDEDRYDVATSVVCYACSQDNVDKTNDKLSAIIEGVMTAMTFSKREEVKAWEQDFVPCEHTLCLVQQDIVEAASTGINSVKTPNSGDANWES
jgi:ubiquitin carboxyl-terminal hydrolase 5/13